MGATGPEAALSLRAASLRRMRFMVNPFLGCNILGNYLPGNDVPVRALSSPGAPRGRPYVTSGHVTAPPATRRRFSLARLTVDRLADQVGVTVVAGVFLDHVHEDPPERDASLATPGRVRLAQ